MTEQFNTTEARAMLDEIERLRTALGLQDGETLVSGTNGSFLIDTPGGDRRRIGLMIDEYRELERLREFEAAVTEAMQAAWRNSRLRKAANDGESAGN